MQEDLIRSPDIDRARRLVFLQRSITQECRGKVRPLSIYCASPAQSKELHCTPEALIVEVVRRLIHTCSSDCVKLEFTSIKDVVICKQTCVDCANLCWSCYVHQARVVIKCHCVAAAVNACCIHFELKFLCEDVRVKRLVCCKLTSVQIGVIRRWRANLFNEIEHVSDTTGSSAQRGKRIRYHHNSAITNGGGRSCKRLGQFDGERGRVAIARMFRINKYVV